MGLVCLSPPVVDPVTISDLHEFMRIDPGDTTQDNTIAGLAQEALAFCEAYTARRFVQQTWRLLVDFFPGYVDLKSAGAKISSPFVSGSNAVLVGIRYAIMLPYPPCMSLVNFIYQNANGQTTSMIQGPVNIGGVTNTLGNPILINTTTPHNLQSGATATLAGNAALLTALGGQASWAITVIDANDFSLNGPLGTGASISATGTVTGYNYVQDLQSNPARLTPVFGQMWPVARVVVNAVQVDFQCGYAIPIVVSMAATTATVTASAYTFLASDVGRPISIPGAGLSGGTLNTTILSVGTTTAVLRDKSNTAVSSVTALLANNPNSRPQDWPRIQRAIKVYTLGAYENRLPMKQVEDTVQRILYPMRDLRF
jgi:hypothetical protein